MSARPYTIGETVRAMKLAMQRNDDASDSDSSIRQHTNRGNKLRRGARNIREGRLDTSGGNNYRKRIEHAGYQRTIIHRNPAIVDVDGDIVLQDEEYDEENCSYVEENPYAEVEIDQLLMPLTAAGDLPEHPSLSHPYTANHLDEIIRSVRDMLHHERHILAKWQEYTQYFQGDEPWAPTEKFELPTDVLLLENDQNEQNNDTQSVSDSVTGVNTQIYDADEMVSPLDTRLNNSIQQNTINGNSTSNTNGVHAIDMANTSTNNDPMSTDLPPESTVNESSTEFVHQPMKTRSRARSPAANSSFSPSASSFTTTTSSQNEYISPFFLPPPSTLPNPHDTLSVPQERASTAMLLLSYTQKQEEVVRSTETLYFGLLKADRLRRQVWKWCRAEGHVGEMSDGEDWYDREEWGLTQDLVKGKDDDEETAVPGGGATNTNNSNGNQVGGTNGVNLAEEERKRRRGRQGKPRV